MMGDLLGSSRVSSQKQNREGMVRAQSGQYCATVESSPGCGGRPRPGCDNLVSEPIPGRKCADEDVGPLLPTSKTTTTTTTSPAFSMMPEVTSTTQWST
ncbi:hypothetical protein PS2_009143 [Malus domestica]